MSKKNLFHRGSFQRKVEQGVAKTGIEIAAFAAPCSTRALFERKVENGETESLAKKKLFRSRTNPSLEQKARQFRWEHFKFFSAFVYFKFVKAFVFFFRINKSHAPNEKLRV